MNRFALVFACGALLVSGCEKQAPRLMVPATSATTAVVRSGLVVIDDTLASDTDYSTGATTLLALNINGQRVGDILVGPWPAGTGLATIRFDSGTSEVVLSNGWAYFYGRWPVPRTTRIVGGSPGAAGQTIAMTGELSVIVDAQGDVQRMFCKTLPSGFTFQAMHTGGGTAVTYTLPANQYVASVPDGAGGYVLNAPATIPNVGAINDLMQFIDTQRRLAHLP